jgi:ribosomal protein S18 acetylase RimI-like enzyme
MIICSITVRRLTVFDTAKYRTVRLHGLLNDPTAFGGCHAEESPLTEAEFAAFITEPPSKSAIFGAFLSNQEMVGVVGLKIPTSTKMQHKATLWGMYTLPSARGLGVGRALMTHLLGYARSQPALERILLAVTASNVVASRWYAKEGFRLYGTEPCAVKFGCNYEDDELRVLDLYGRIEP